MAHRMTANNLNSGFGDAKVVGEDIDKSLIGFTVLRRFSHRYSVLLLGKLYNLGFFGVGLDRYRYLQPHD